MATKVIAWQTGSGNITLTYQGQGDGTITVQSDDNNLSVARSQTITVKTANNAVSQTLTINQEAREDYSLKYLTIVSRADNNVIGLKQTGADISKTVEVSTDLSTWTSYTSNTSGVTLATLNTGDKLYVKGIANAYASSTSKYNTFTSTGNFDVEGNIMSLLYGDDFASKTTYPSTYTFLKMFDSSKVVNAKNLILPATKARSRCYHAMFGNCTRMITAPKLPAKTLGTYCYYGMFNHTAITEAPELPATTLATYCYYRMFSGCTGLTKSPVLPAKTLTGSCYYQMFWQCSNLNHVTMLATDRSASNCLYGWLNSVAATGTLVKDASMTTLPKDSASGIPSGWTVVDYSE